MTRFLQHDILTLVGFIAKRVLPALGIYFLIVGLFAAMNIAQYYREVGLIPWPFVGYMGLDVLRGIGFYARERWILYLSALHAAAYTCLNIVSIVAGVSPGVWLVAVNSIVSWGILLLLYTARPYLTNSRYSRPEAVVFLVLWCVMFYYTLTQTFTIL